MIHEVTQAANRAAAIVKWLEASPVAGIHCSKHQHQSWFYSTIHPTLLFTTVQQKIERCSVNLNIVQPSVMCSEYSLVKAHFKYGKYGNIWKLYGAYFIVL